MHRTGREGFTLIEISIVLVIIALVIGGVLLGHDLIQAAETRSVIKQVDQFKAAANTFASKYNCLPGDCRDATDFFGTNPNCAISGVGTGTQTCNGDGNGRVDNGSLEMVLFWQHLGNAGMLNGNYTGAPISPPSMFGSQIGVNVPGSAISGTGYGSRFMGTQSGTAGWYDGFYGNEFEMGSVANPWQWPCCGGLTTQQAFDIDTKMDDGVPASGSVLTWSSAISPGCTTSDTASLAAYNLAASDRKCGLIFTKAF